jgi:hypothetical protein
MVEEQNTSFGITGKNESDHTLLHKQTTNTHTTCRKAIGTCAHKPIESHTLFSL